MLWYLRARNYDPRAGRFTQRDPFAGIDAQPNTLHDYMYAGNDPAYYVDRDGRFMSAGGAMTAAGISMVMRGMAIYGTANTAASFMKSLAAGDTEEVVEQAGIGLLMMLGPVAFSRYAVTFGKRLQESRRFQPLISCVLGNSFTGDTLVRTRRGLIPIKDVKIGDYVLSFDETTGQFGEQPVVRLIQREKAEEYVVLGLDDGETIEATSEHPFYVAGIWVEAAKLNVSDLLTTETGKEVRVRSIRRDHRTATAYNLEIANTHTYTITEDCIVVHNAGGGCGDLDLLFKVVLQKGGNTFAKSTAKALNETFGRNLSPRDWGRALEKMKGENGLRRDHHGEIRGDGSYVDIEGKIVGNLEAYL